jgi:hypothetical protein
VKRVAQGFKRAVQLYLIVVGGGFGLAALIGVVLNLKESLESADPKEAMGYRNDLRVESLLLLFAVLFSTAGVGVVKSRMWGFVLAMVLAIATVMYSLVQNLQSFSDYHDFTIALPMFVIFIWGMFPATWSLFRKQEVKAS